MAESEEELKSLLMTVKEESEKVGLKLNIKKKLRSGHPVSSLPGKWKEKKWKQWQILSSWIPKSQQVVTAAAKLKDAFSWKKSYDTPRQCITKQGHHFADTGPYRQSCGFSMYGYEGWTTKRRLRAEELILSNRGAG